MKCYIMDDQYWKVIYEGLSKIYQDRDFPIKENINNPLEFLNNIKENDLILLDNFFPWETREEPLWAEFLNKLIEKNITCKVICISDYWKLLIDRYFERDQAVNDWIVIWFAPDKSVNSIKEILTKIYS